jgi:hypothetical protein
MLPIAGLEFVTPEGWALAVTAVIPVVALAVAFRRSERAHALVGFPPPVRRSGTLALVCAIATTMLLAAAVAQPVIRSRGPHRLRSDAEIFVVLDTSRSMLAASGPRAVTRFDRARTAAEQLRARLPDVKTGLASFTDRVLPNLFPSPDETAFARTLQRASAVESPPPLSSRSRATDLSALASMATQGFFDPGVTRRVAVVVTDGETVPVDVPALRRALESTNVQLVFMEVPVGYGDRVYGPTGLPEAGYRPDAAARRELASTASSLGAGLISSADPAAAARAVRARLGSGPTGPAGVAPATTFLAPWFVLAALLPLAGLVWRAR